MPTLTPGQNSRSTTPRAAFYWISLVGLLAIVLLVILGVKMESDATPPSAVDRETTQRVYDPDFLKILSAPAPSAAAETAPGTRHVKFPDPESFNNPSPPGQSKPGSYEVALDTSHQVLNLTVPEDVERGRGDEAAAAPIFPSFSEAGLDGSFTPAAALALKAKQFDDGLYACVELAADAGLGHFPGRKTLLLELLKGLPGDSDRAAAALLTAAAHLGGQQPSVGPEVARQAQALQQKFMADELRSKVLGFYTWSEELERVFQRDRMLQTPLDAPAAHSLAAALARSDDLLKAYVASLSLNEKLTNPLAGDDLRPAALALKNGGTPSFAGHPSLFPPSQATETNLIKMLYGGRPIPEGFNLADEMVKRLSAGQLDLKPKPDSGWYDYQTYALEPLAIPERMPEAQRLQFDESYRKELVGLFKALLALTRETHVKQLEMPRVGMAMPRRIVRLKVSPDLSLEPLPAYYQRRANSYRFVRKVLQQSFGPEALTKVRRLTAAGPVNLPLASELTLMETLFDGAALRSAKEIGMMPEAASGAKNSANAHVQQAVLEAWLESLGKDPDLGRDIRMMVPVFYDTGRQKTKVWAVLGIANKPLSVSYATPPTVKGIKGPGGKVVKSGDVEVDFVPQGARLAYIVSAEVYVSRLLNRTEFRQLCDQKKTYQAIVDSLK